MGALADILFTQIRENRGDLGERAAANLIAQSPLSSRDDVADALLVTDEGNTYPSWALFAINAKRLPLSSGERRLVQVACSLAGFGDVNLADVLSSLDSDNRMHMLESIGYAATGRWMTSRPQMSAALTPAEPEQPAEPCDEWKVDLEPGHVLAFDEVGNRDVRTTFVGVFIGKLVFESEVGFVDGPIGDPNSDVHQYSTMTAAIAGHHELVNGLRGPNWLAPSGEVPTATAPEGPRVFTDAIPVDVDEVDSADAGRWTRDTEHLAGGWYSCEAPEIRVPDDTALLDLVGHVTEVLAAAEQPAEVQR